MGRVNKGGDKGKDGIPRPRPWFCVTRWSGRILIMFILDFSRPRQGAERSWLAQAPEARVGSAPPPGRASPGRSCACRASVRLRAFFFCGVFEKVVCSGVAGGHRDARDPPGAATSRLTPSLTSAPPRRGWPTLRQPLPQTHTDLIKRQLGWQKCSLLPEG